jgi:hypothetical protein
MLLATSFSTRVVFFAAAMTAAASFAGGCGDSQPKCPPASPCSHRDDGGDRDDGGNRDDSADRDDGGNRDDSADRDNGGTAHDGSSTDVAVDAPPSIFDVCSAGASGGSCRDVDCSCFIADGESRPTATVSLDCLCTKSIGCPDYATARANCQPSETVLFTYPSCGLEIIRHRYDLYGPGASYVYDATTHALVGGFYGSDSAIGECGGKVIIGRRGGTFPPPDCKVGETKYVCRADASN